MLLVAECRRIDCGEPAYDGQRSDLRLDRKPVLDRQEIRIELRGHTNALLVSPFRPAVRGSHFGGRGHRAERAGKHVRISRRYAGCCRKTALADPLAELFLRRTDLGKQLHGIESAVCRAQTALDRWGEFRVCQRTFVRCGRRMIAFDDLRALSTFLLELERRLEEVHVLARCRIETRHHAGRLDPIEPPVADEPPDDRAVLLLHEGLIVFLVGAGPRYLDLLRSAPRNNDVVHERTVVIEVGATDHPREQALRSRHRFDDEAAIACHQGQAFCPSCRDIHHGQRLDERASDAGPTCATMSISQKPGGGFAQWLKVRIGTSRRIAE